MSFVKQDTTLRELEEDFLYHVSESDYHLEQYLSATKEAENHLKKYKEHCDYRFDVTLKLQAVSHAFKYA
jgi:hypothetical protein